jgi:hypothetical protein
MAAMKHRFGIDLVQDALLVLARQWPTALKLSAIPLLISFLSSMFVVTAFLGLQFNVRPEPPIATKGWYFFLMFALFALIWQFIVGASMVPLISAWSRRILGQGDDRWIRIGRRELKILAIWSLCYALSLAFVAALVLGLYNLLEELNPDKLIFPLIFAGLPLLLVVLWLFYLVTLPLIVSIPLVALGASSPLRMAVSVTKQSRLRLSVALSVVTIPILFVCILTEDETIDLVFVAVLTMLIGGIVSVYLRDHSGAPPGLAINSAPPNPPALTS